MRRPRILLGLVAFAVVWSASPNGPSVAGAAPPAPTRNLLPNPSFEEGAGDRPRAWKPARWSGRGAWRWAEIGHTGRRSVLIESADGADVAWTTTVAVEPFSRYRLSAWIKTEGVAPKGGRGALLNLHDLQPVATKALTGTRDWTKVEVEFETEDQASLQVNCLFGGWGLATGKAWFDDLRLEKIGTRPLPPPAIRIDAGRRAEPISKYIYGQFIEHLGRCIYGGIWAEMIEDRKFFFPVTAKFDPFGKGRRPDPEVPLPDLVASPWEIAAGEVRMVKEDPFVGEHAPRLAPDAVLRQHYLGIVKGKRYNGYLWVKPLGREARLRVALAWQGGRAETDLAVSGGGYHKATFSFTAGATTDQAVFEIQALGPAPCVVGTVSLMPADAVEGIRADTLAVLKRLAAPVYRWPGGNFVSGYNWRDGIGPRDRRPPRKNPAWRGIEPNDFGLHEFLRFCELVGAEPYIAVNSGLGDARSAAQEVEYVNGSPETPMGRLRAENGRREPWKVRFWGIGNEMYGGWQLGHMPLEKYVEKHNRFAEAMRAVDPSIRLVAVGAVGKWSETMLRRCAEHMDLISEHFYRGAKPGLLAHVRQMPQAVRAKADAHRRYRRDIPGLAEKDIRIALDEWNYWYGPHVFGQLGTRYFLKDALGVAEGLHEMFRNSDLFYMANYAQTVNVIGAVKTTRTGAAALETTGLVLMMYRHHYGRVPVATETDGLIDAQAAWADDGRTLTVGLVNPTREPAAAALTVRGARLTGRGRRWVLAGTDPMDFNHPGRPPKVTVREEPVRGSAKTLEVPPLSVTIFALETE